MYIDVTDGQFTLARGLCVTILEVCDVTSELIPDKNIGADMEITVTDQPVCRTLLEKAVDNTSNISI